MKIRFCCHYCPAAFPDFRGLVRHFEAVYRDRDEHIVLELPADKTGAPVIAGVQSYDKEGENDLSTKI